VVIFASVPDAQALRLLATMATIAIEIKVFKVSPFEMMKWI